MNTTVRGLTKTFNNFTALHSIHLTINSGEFVAILGPSGCGKTTLLRLLAGFEAPTAGEIRMNDRVVAGKGVVVPPERRNLGMVFQSFALWPHMNVREHVLFPLRNRRERLAPDVRGHESEYVDEVLRMVGLFPLANRMPAELSGGQKQRVALARAIAAKPSLLLMDEPLSALDVELRMEMRKEIQVLHHKTGAAIVYVTHDQGEALAMADRIIVMKDGRIEQIGTPQEIYTRPKSEFVASFVGKANLVKGKWEKDRFIPQVADLVVTWQPDWVDEQFRTKGLCPVRPEQLRISESGPGVIGRITNTQYQGREVHYTVDVCGQAWEVHGPVTHTFARGSVVSLHYVQEQVVRPQKQLTMA